MSYSAGILPYTIYNGQIYFLLGRTKYDGSWSDFGGGEEKSDKNVHQTAIREFYEETIGTVQDISHLKNTFKKKNFNEFTGLTTRGRQYHMFLIFIPHKNYTLAFKKNLSFVTYTHLPQKYQEMTDIKWFEHTTLKNAELINLRDVFKETFTNNYEKIMSSIQSSGST